MGSNRLLESAWRGIATRLRKSAHLHGAAIPAALGQRRHEPMDADGQPSCARKIAPESIRCKTQSIRAKRGIRPNDGGSRSRARPF